MPSINFSIYAGLIPFHNLWCKDFKLSKNKNLEVELVLNDALIAFELDLSFRGRSHAGPGLSISLLFLTFGVQIYDGRHWDHERGRWKDQDSSQKLR